MLQFLAGFNIILGLIGFGWLLGRTVRRSHEYPREVLMLLYLAIALFFGLLTTSVTVFLAGGVTVHALIISVVKVYALWVLWKTRTTKYRTGTRQKDGNPGAKQNEDIA